MFYHLSWSNISNPFKPCIPLQLRISALRCATVPRYLEAVSRMIVSPPGEALELAQGPARGGLNHELAQQNLEMLGLCVLSCLSKIGYMYFPNHYPMVYHHISSFFDWKMLNMVYFQIYPIFAPIWRCWTKVAVFWRKVPPVTPVTPIYRKCLHLNLTVTFWEGWLTKEKWPWPDPRTVCQQHPPIWISRPMVPRHCGWFDSLKSI